MSNDLHVCTSMNYSCVPWSDSLEVLVSNNLRAPGHLQKAVPHGWLLCWI